MQSGKIAWKPCVLIALAIAGLLPQVFFEVSRLLRRALPPPIDARYALIRAALPAQVKQIGYLSDDGDSAYRSAELFAQAQYSLSPHVLVRGVETRYIVVNVGDSRRLGEILANHGLRPMVASPEGVALALMANSDPGSKPK